MGWLAMSSRFTASSRRSAASAKGTAGPGDRAVLAERDWGAARIVVSFNLQSKGNNGVGILLGAMGRAGFTEPVGDDDDG